ncbi:ABC transporter permease [Hoeflea olei]|uniref:Peptide permease n=1 Tax=Hoeflea olei TaxID=1480615 RepID=A0A1C1YRL6_9HYPH|nr:ABC transporter permease [Hoeflea olei]OCW56017.1 peptide permease [Hoeflea olei]
MTLYVVRRIGAGILLLLALSMLVFFLLRLAPGDPLSSYIDPMVSMTEQDMERLRQSLGLDQPLPFQYIYWLGETITGDLGRSLQRNGQPVSELLMASIGPSMLLMLSGSLLAILFGIVIGIVGAVRRDGPADVILAALSSVGVSSPAFLTALVGLYVFSGVLHWAPAGGMQEPGMPFTLSGLLSHLALPALILAFGQTALIARYMRSSLLEVLHQDFIRTARAKGVPRRKVILKHAVRNALLPVVTLIGSTLGLAVGGAIFIESVFNWPGMGLMMVTAVEARDYPLIMGGTLAVGAWVILANILTDVAYAFIDPRIKVG